MNNEYMKKVKPQIKQCLDNFKQSASQIRHCKNDLTVSKNKTNLLPKEHLFLLNEHGDDKSEDIIYCLDIYDVEYILKYGVNPHSNNLVSSFNMQLLLSYYNENVDNDINSENVGVMSLDKYFSYLMKSSNISNNSSSIDKELGKIKRMILSSGKEYKDAEIQYEVIHDIVKKNYFEDILLFFKLFGIKIKRVNEFIQDKFLFFIKQNIEFAKINEIHKQYFNYILNFFKCLKPLVIFSKTNFYVCSLPFKILNTCILTYLQVFPPINDKVSSPSPKRELSINKKILKNTLGTLYNNNVYSQNFDDESMTIKIHNTFSYLYNYMKNGIYVSIRNNSINAFLIFSNNNFTQIWGPEIVKSLGTSSNTVDTYYKNKLQYFNSKRIKYRKENIITDTKKWWLNGNIIDNEDWEWGTHLVPELFDMMNTLCKERIIKDCDFFINKRDHPQLKKDLTEPYDFISKSLLNKPINTQKAKLFPIENTNDDNKDTYLFAPIFSFFTDDKFADIPFPTTDDWRIATQKIFDSSSFHGKDIYINKNNEYVPYNKRINTVFFRGSATGGGVTIDYNNVYDRSEGSHNGGFNQRLFASYVSKLWESDNNFNKNNKVDGIPFLDAGVTTWNIRDKKVSVNSPMTYIQPSNFNFGLKNFVPMYEATRYKYILYIDGHCAAARYSFLLKSGAVIFKVESLPTTPGKELWFFPLLKPWVDYIPIQSDMMDLAEKIVWAKTHEKECELMSQKATEVYKQHLSKERILDYLEYTLSLI
jgi:hypothetical protein